MRNILSSAALLLVLRYVHVWYLCIYYKLLTLFTAPESPLRNKVVVEEATKAEEEYVLFLSHLLISRHFIVSFYINAIAHLVGPYTTAAEDLSHSDLSFP